jgi:hypothetical protein
MLVGFHVEGYDYLIFRAFIAQLCNYPEEQIEPDWIDKPGRGWQFVLEHLPKALHRFYYKSAYAVIIGMDNDGNLDLMNDIDNRKEDPEHPRHWLHPENSIQERCRWCELQSRIERERPRLNWSSNISGRDWPIIIAVPTEMIESWLLIAQAILDHGKGSFHAEKESRHSQKWRFYSKPEPGLKDVENKALPLIRSLSLQHLLSLGEYSNSFSLFAKRVDEFRSAVFGNNFQ